MLYFSIAIVCKDGLCSLTKIRASGVTSHHLRTSFLLGILRRVREQLDSGSLIFRAPVKKVSHTCSMCWATIPLDEGNLVLTFALVDGKRVRTAPSRARERHRVLRASGRHHWGATMAAGLWVEMKGKLNRSLNLTAHVVSSYGAYIMH